MENGFFHHKPFASLILRVIEGRMCPVGEKRVSPTLRRSPPGSENQTVKEELREKYINAFDINIM